MRQKLYVEALHCLVLYFLHRQHSLTQPKTKTAEATRRSKEEEGKQYKTKRQGSISAHYAFLEESIATDLERATQNITPLTANVMSHYRVMKKQILNKNSCLTSARANSTTRMVITEDPTFTSQHSIP